MKKLIVEIQCGFCNWFSIDIFSGILGIFMILLDYFWVISRRVVLLGNNAAIMGKLISQNVRIWFWSIIFFKRFLPFYIKCWGRDRRFLRYHLAFIFYLFMNREDYIYYNSIFIIFYKSNFRYMEKDVQSESIPSRRIRRRGRALRSRRHVESQQPDDTLTEKPDSPIENP